MLKTGAYASGTTVNPGGVGPWAGDLVVTLVKAGVVSTVRFNTCRFKADYSVAAEANTIALSWEAHGRAGRSKVEIS